MIRSVLEISVALAILLAPTSRPQGYGANAKGGESGDVYEVTSLLDEGTRGTLRHAISSAHGPRTVHFKVGGTIALARPLKIARPAITIEGSSAPAPGITLVHHALIIAADDVIVRHLRVRLGTEGNKPEDAISIVAGHDILIDHCSATWAIDETLSVTGTADRVTVQWSLLGESLNRSIHPSGAHGHGSLIRPSKDAHVSWHHNLYAHHDSRTPRPGSYDGALLRFDFRNNVIYNWGTDAGYVKQLDERVEMNYVGNYLVAGPSSTWRDGGFYSPSKNISIYQAGNWLDGKEIGWTLFSGTFTVAKDAFDVPRVETQSAEQAWRDVLDQVGALPRDAIDARIIDTVRTRRGAIVDRPPR